jgi:hypothetical protein
LCSLDFYLLAIGVPFFSERGETKESLAGQRMRGSREEDKERSYRLIDTNFSILYANHIPRVISITIWY